MVRQKPQKAISVPSDLQLTDKIYNEWQAKIDEISIPDEICQIVSHIRRFMKEEAKEEKVNEMDYYISDRRWKKCFHLMQTSAFLNGRKAVDVTDVPLLFSCLWNKAEAIPVVIDIVCNSLTASLDIQIVNQTKEIEKALKRGPQSGSPNAQTIPDDDFKIVNFFYYQLHNHPSGRVLFFKPDYNHVDIHRSINGILFYDQDKNSWIVHAIYTGTPFDYQTKAGSKVVKVKVMKCHGGIIINGTAYAFERKSALEGASLFSSMELVQPNVAAIALNIIEKDIRPKLTALQDMFTRSKHLFLSNDDLNVVKKYLANCEKRLNELEVKATNAKQLI